VCIYSPLLCTDVLIKIIEMILVVLRLQMIHSLDSIAFKEINHYRYKCG